MLPSIFAIGQHALASCMLASVVNSLPNGLTKGTPNPVGHRLDPFDDYMDPVSLPRPLTGDLLNTTRCFCQPPNAEHYDPKGEAGHYFEWIYYNFHSDTYFNVSRWCRSSHHKIREVPNPPGMKRINDCLAYWEGRQHTPSCDYDSMGNTFCTQIEADNGDWIWYNQDHRVHNGLHDTAPGIEVRSKCRELCSRAGTEEDIALRGRMEMLAGQYRADLNHHLGEHQDLLWSYIDSDYHIPDMCNDCK